MFIDVQKTKGWIVVRTFPGNICPASPKLDYDFVQIWPSYSSYPPGTWFANFVSDEEKYRHHASVFLTYELAVKVIEYLHERWGGPGTVFCVMPTNRKPTVRNFP